MSTSSDLTLRRRQAVQAWTAFVELGDALEARVRPEILSSWQRSTAAALRPTLDHAPLGDEADARAWLAASPLQLALERVEPELRRTAEDGDLVLAVTDEQTRILWTYGGRVMRRKAETVNFVPGGHWDEASVGSNALNLAARNNAPSMVFSAEHYAPIVHNWVCWAAPLHDPLTGRQLGVVDLSTTWDRTHPIGLATARVLARLIETALPHPGYPSPTHPVPEPHGGGLTLTLLGTAAVFLDGDRMLLNRRQTEILALLALSPDGLGLEQLHALLYGDEPVTVSTLKAEVSHLRTALGGRLASRPYRLTLPVSTDVDEVLRLLRRGEVLGATKLYGGDLMPGTNSPRLAELAEYVAVALREALLADPSPDAVLAYSETAPYDTEVLEVCLARLGDAPHPDKPLLRGRLAAARR